MTIGGTSDDRDLTNHLIKALVQRFGQSSMYSSASYN